MSRRSCWVFAFFFRSFMSCCQRHQNRDLTTWEEPTNCLSNTFTHFLDSKRSCNSRVEWHDNNGSLCVSFCCHFSSLQETVSFSRQTQRHNHHQRCLWSNEMMKLLWCHSENIKCHERCQVKHTRKTDKEVSGQEQNSWKSDIKTFSVSEKSSENP